MSGILAAIVLALACASDDVENEGLFHNDGPSSLYCYKDTDKPRWQICYTQIARGQECRGDAVGKTVEGPVYKIPNRVQFKCTAPSNDAPPPPNSTYCNPANRMSAVVMKLAKLRHKDGYEGMTFEHFYSLMTGNRKRGEVAVSPCGGNKRTVPTGLEKCYPEPFHSELKQMSGMAEVLPK